MEKTLGSGSIGAANVAYDAFLLAGYGGSAVALFFLLADALNGQPFFTPSVMGSVLFEGATTENVVEVSMQMVAYYTIVHFGMFGLLGLAIAFLFHEVELHSRHPVLILLVLFLIFELGFALAAALLLPGVIATLGPLRVGVANGLAAATMAFCLLISHRGRSSDSA